MSIANLFRSNTKYFKRIFVLFIIFTVIFALVAFICDIVNELTFNNSSAQSALETIYNQLGPDFDPDAPVTWYDLFLNNTRVLLTSFVTSFIPFIFIPVFFLLINAGVIGLSCATFSYFTGVSSWAIFLSGMLPHGIIELPAFILGGCCGIHVCFNISKRIFKKTDTYELSDTIISSVKFLFTVCVPLLLIASFIEAYLTPIIMGAFLGF